MLQKILKKCVFCTICTLICLAYSNLQLHTFLLQAAKGLSSIWCDHLNIRDVTSQFCQEVVFDLKSAVINVLHTAKCMTVTVFSWHSIHYQCLEIFRRHVGTWDLCSRFKFLTPFRLTCFCHNCNTGILSTR